MIDVKVKWCQQRFFNFLFSDTHKNLMDCEQGSGQSHTFVMSVIEQVIFVGTGCSSNTPALKCLLEDPPTCDVCLLALTEEGWKNRRKNPSVLIRVRDHRDPNGRLR